MEKIFLNKKILLTRSLKESKEFKKLLLKANFPGKVIIFPLLEIQYLEPKLELENYDVLIATSLHALKKYKNLLTNSNLNVFSVGKRTNDFLEKQGVNKLFNYKKVSDLLLSLEKFLEAKNFKTIYLRGNNISLDIKSYLKTLGHEIDEKIVYKQKMKKALREVEKIINDKNLRGVALFSEKSVEFLRKNCSNIPLDKTFFCFSEKIEKKVKYLISEHAKCVTLSSPIIEKMAETISTKFTKIVN